MKGGRAYAQRLLASRRTLDLRRLSRQQQIAACSSLAGVATGIAATLLPASWFDWSGTVVALAPTTRIAPAVLSLVLLSGAAVCFVSGIHDDKVVERLGAVGVGVCAIVLSGDALRRFLELAVLRRMWRPDLLVAQPTRALPVFWMYAAGAALVAVFVSGIVAVVLAPLSRPVRTRRRAVRVAAAAPAVALAMLLIAQYVLGERLLGALGWATAETPAFAPPTARVFLTPFYRLHTFAALELAVGFWGAVELARFGADLVSSVETGRTGHRVERILGAVAATAVLGAIVVGRGRLLPRTLHPMKAFGNVVHAATGDLLLRNVMTLGALCFLAAGVLVWLGLASAERSLRRSDSDYILPAPARAVSPAFPGLIPLTTLVALTFAAPVVSALAAPIRFAFQAPGFYRYWSLANIVPPEMTRVDMLHVIVPALGGFGLLGLIFCVAEESRPFGFFATMLCLPMALLAPNLRDPVVLLMLIAAFVVAVFFGVMSASPDATERTWQLGALGVIAIGLLLLVYALPIDLPLPLLLAGTIALRFGWLADDLTPKDDADPAAAHRIWRALSLALLLTGLATADCATGGTFAGETFRALGQDVAIPFVGIPLLVAIVYQRQRRLDTANAT